MLEFITVPVYLWEFLFLDESGYLMFCETLLQEQILITSGPVEDISFDSCLADSSNIAPCRARLMIIQLGSNKSRGAHKEGEGRKQPQTKTNTGDLA